MTDYSQASSTIGSQEFVWGQRTFIMGIINVTPDSFSGDGLMSPHFERIPLGLVAEHAWRLANEGADILDIGGESTRPGATPVSEKEELSRVVPAIRAVRQGTDLPISIDTSKAAVARAAIDAGADMVNDVWGLRLDPEMRRVVAETGVPVILMHNRSRARDAERRERLGGRYVGVQYKDLMRDIIAELNELVHLALEAGISRHQIIVDPGIGFGKTVEQNLELVRRLSELRELAFPIMIGPSRKSFVGYTLDLPPDDRVEGTLAVIGAAMMQRAVDLVRVHDVRQTVRFARMLDTILAT